MNVINLDSESFSRFLASNFQDSDLVGLRMQWSIFFVDSSSPLSLLKIRVSPGSDVFSFPAMLTP